MGHRSTVAPSDTAVPAARKKIAAGKRDLAAATAAHKTPRSKIPATSCAPAVGSCGHWR